jgi:hypothetical protein
MPLALAVLATIVGIGASRAAADDTTRPNPGLPGQWVNLGRVSASHSADHDRITVKGKYDDFRRLKFTVRDAGLNLRRVVVTYDRGGGETLNVREDIPKGGETRPIDLNGAKRSIRTIEFWYDTKGLLGGKSDVTAWGQR